MAGKRIISCLLVEDDPEDQEIFLDALHSIASDCGCYAVSNGEEALFTLIDEDFEPDFIFTDVNMPRMGGLEFLEILKGIEKFKKIPVIVYTSEFSDDIVQKSKELGATAIFSKTRSGALKDILKKYLARQPDII